MDQQQAKAPRRALVARRTPAGNREQKQKQQQQQKGSGEHDDIRSVASTTATTHVATRLASLLDAPADGSAFMSLSKKITQEEKALAAAPKMKAQRRSRLEIVAEDQDDFDEVHGDDDDDDDDENENEDATSHENKKTAGGKQRKIVDIVDSSSGTTKSKKAGAMSKNQQQQQQQRAASDGGTAKNDGDDDDAAKSGLKLLKAALRNQNHNRVLPHQERPDYEYRMRRIATSGAVRLFNALSHAQSAGLKAAQAVEQHRQDSDEEDGGLGTSDKSEHRKVTASREAFMAALRGAASSKAKH